MRRYHEMSKDEIKDSLIPYLEAIVKQPENTPEEKQTKLAKLGALITKLAEMGVTPSSGLDNPANNAPTIDSRYLNIALNGYLSDYKSIYGTDSSVRNSLQMIVDFSVAHVQQAYNEAMKNPVQRKNEFNEISRNLDKIESELTSRNPPLEKYRNNLTNLLKRAERLEQFSLSQNESQRLQRLIATTERLQGKTQKLQSNEIDDLIRETTRTFVQIESGSLPTSKRGSPASELKEISAALHQVDRSIMSDTQIHRIDQLAKTCERLQRTLTISPPPPSHNIAR